MGSICASEQFQYHAHRYACALLCRESACDRRETGVLFRRSPLRSGGSQDGHFVRVGNGADAARDRIQAAARRPRRDFDFGWRAPDFD